MKSAEKELKMIWEVKKDGRQSFLVGTAHFFSHSFRSSLFRYISEARHVLIEGPMDKKNMDRVVKSGFEKDGKPHIFDDLDREVVDRITKIFAHPGRGKRFPFIILNPGHFDGEDSIYDSLDGMKPWMAFFTLWHKFTGKLGWKHSVDMEAYTIALGLGKEVIPLETIEEQIAVLNGIPRERVVEFISHIDRWEEYAREYEKYYLAGDLDNLKSVPGRFPTLRFSVIGERDRILYRRMKKYLEEGDTIAFVGAPHIRGINELLRLDGYRSTSIVQLMEKIMVKKGFNKPANSKASGRRIDREIKTIKAMIGIYCKKKHKTKGLCPDCQELLAYAVDRLKGCPYGEDKPPCKHCPVHCYEKEYRARIREVMSFAGPLMPIYHPVMAVKHTLDGLGKKDK